MPKLGEVLVRLGRYTDAEALLRAEVERGEPSAQALGLLALAKTGCNDAAGALAAYEQALRLAPDDANIRGRYADLLGNLGRTQEAFDQFNRVVAVAPDNAPAHHRMGVLAAIIGRLDEGSAHLERAVTLEPRNVQMLCDLAMLRKKQRRLPEAAEILRHAAALDPKDPRPAKLMKKLSPQGTHPR